MTHTIGLIGPNGNVGKAAVKYLLPYHQSGQVKMVILHRPGGPPRELQSGVDVETRVLDLESGDTEAVGKAIQGLNVIVSMIAPEKIGLEPTLAEGMANSKDLVYYIPSLFGRPWRLEEKFSEQKQQLSKFLFAGRDRAAKLGVKSALIQTGYFDHSLFRDNLLGANLKKNELKVSAKQLANRLPITSCDYLGAAIATVVVRPPQENRGKTFSAVQFRASGREIADIFTKPHGGQQTNIIDFTEEDLQGLYDDVAGFGVAIAGYRENWEMDEWDFAPAIEVNGKPAESLEAVIRKWQ